MRPTLDLTVFCGDAGLPYVDAELDQFAVYARCAPQWVCNAHLPDQPPDRGRHPGAAPPRPRLPAPHRTTVSGRTMASASRVFGNRWQTQPRTILSTAKDHTRLGLPRRSTMICCRNTRISASTAARGRNRSTTIPKISLLRSNISQKIVRFCVPRQPDRICDRDNSELVSQRQDFGFQRRP